MGTGGAGVNLVAGDGGESGEVAGEYEYDYECEYEDNYEAEHGEEYECEYEGLWVGTIGATEVPENTGRSLDTITGRESMQDNGQTETGYKNLGERDYNSQRGVWSGGEEAGDEQWDSEPEAPEPGAEEAEDPRQGPLQQVPGSRPWPAHREGTGRSRAKPRPRAALDQQWEEARRSAWLRQLLSDSSSDEEGGEGEERFGRFAESGRWMAELYGIPQQPTATLGRECSV
jgi:hypothetical protein